MYCTVLLLDRLVTKPSRSPYQCKGQQPLPLPPTDTAGCHWVSCVSYNHSAVNVPDLEFRPETQTALSHYTCRQIRFPYDMIQCGATVASSRPQSAEGSVSQMDVVGHYTVLYCMIDLTLTKIYILRIHVSYNITVISERSWQCESGLVTSCMHVCLHTSLHTNYCTNRSNYYSTVLYCSSLVVTGGSVSATWYVLSA